jgi:hypothetical protein
MGGVGWSAPSEASLLSLARSHVRRGGGVIGGMWMWNVGYGLGMGSGIWDMGSGICRDFFWVEESRGFFFFFK